MRWARAFAALLSIAALVAVVVASRASSPAARLPVGPGRDLARQNCLICHSAMLITQQHKDSTGWEKTVGLMQKWGAPVRATAHDTLITYLRTHFGGRPTGSSAAVRPSTPSRR